MLTTLFIKDFVIVQSNEIHFKQGLTVFTGETGAGKSIIMNAIALCLGEKARPDLVRTGATQADITAIFEPTPAIIAWLKEQALDSSTLIIRRVIDIQGKSKAFINGIPSTLNQLKELAQQLIDIHGQHAHQNLLKPLYQMRLLDEQGKNQPLYEQVKEAWKHWKAQELQLQEAREKESENKQKLERLYWQFNEIQSLNIRPSEWEEIQEEHTLLSHTAELVQTLSETQYYITQDRNGIEDQLGQCIRQLQSIVKIDPKLNNILETLESSRIQCKEASYEIAHYLDKADLNEARLFEIEQRLQSIYGCSKRFGIAPEHLFSSLEQLQEEINILEQTQDIEYLEKEVEVAKNTYFEYAYLLTQARQITAENISKQVTAGMQTLAMKGGQFKIEISPSEPSSHGLERIQFLVSGHTGSEPKPLQKVASGGELARISLLLSVIATQAKQVPTLIFDEVDTGVGGAVADQIGALLRKLGKTYQVLCITHLPQVAAKGHHHIEVKKYEEQGQTSSDLKPLSEKERIQEIARMLAGSHITHASLENATTLLSNALED